MKKTVDKQRFMCYFIKAAAEQERRAELKIKKNSRDSKKVLDNLVQTW